MEPALFLMDVRIITATLAPGPPVNSPPLELSGTIGDHMMTLLPLAQGLFDRMGMVNLVSHNFPSLFFPTHFKKVADSHCEFFDSYLKVFDFQTVGGFSFLFLLLVANLIPLWSDNILCII